MDDDGISNDAMLHTLLQPPRRRPPPPPPLSPCLQKGTIGIPSSRRARGSLGHGVVSGVLLLVVGLVAGVVSLDDSDSARAEISTKAKDCCPGTQRT